jgi:hypothetical protein
MFKNKNHIKSIVYLTLIMGLPFLFNGCTFHLSNGTSMGYNMSGAKVPVGCKTVFVKYFQNRASIVNPTLAMKITDALKDKLTGQTNLKIINQAGAGDANFEGDIVGYTNEPTQVKGGDNATASINKLEVKISMKYYNLKDAEFDYETTFSRYKEYDASMTLEAAESAYIDDLVSQLVDDIFNKAFVNW